MDNEIIYSLKPIYADLILNKKKNHEFRSVKPKKIPSRIWFYTTLPKAQLQYIAEVREIIEYPQKIKEAGEGNQDFNNDNKNGNFAYPILHLYTIKNPISLSELKSKYNFTPPQGFVYLLKYKDLYNDVINKIGIEKIY